MPSRRKRSRVAEPRFLFVAEDPSTDHSTGIRFSSGRSKQSHVQRLHFERKKRAALERASTVPLPEQSKSSLYRTEERCASDVPKGTEASKSLESSLCDTGAAEDVAGPAKELAKGRDAGRKGRIETDRSR